MNHRIATLFVLGCTALAGGCSSLKNSPEHGLDVAERHPISVDAQIVTLTLDVGAGALSSIDRARLNAFADAYVKGGHGPLTVTKPLGSANDQRALAAASEIATMLDRAGVPASAMESADYRTADSKQEILLSYTHYVATPSACGDFTNEAERAFRNIRTPNFGCATQNNFAALVADPYDFIAPAEPTAADGPARARVIDKYRKGEVTASETDSEIQAQVSDQ